jgi:hypothetical protein
MSRNKLTKEVKDLYNENYKPLKKEIEKDIRRWKYLAYSWIGRNNIVKMPILLKAIYVFNVIPIKITMTFLTEIEKSLKFIWKHKRQQIAKALLSKKSNAGGIIILNFKLYYRAIAIKTTWSWHKNKHKDQWNRVEDPDLNPLSNSHLIFHKCTQNI